MAEQKRQKVNYIMKELKQKEVPQQQKQLTCCFTEVVKELQQKYKDIYLIAYLPYQKKLFSKEIAELLPCCKEICVAEIENQKGCYHLRNRYMIEHSSLLIAVTDGKQGGGTDYTIKYGQKMGIHIEKIYF